MRVDVEVLPDKEEKIAKSKFLHISSEVVGAKSSARVWRQGGESSLSQDIVSHAQGSQICMPTQYA